MDVIRYQRYWLRRDTAANWASVNPILAAGEVGIVTDSGNPLAFKIGDGVAAWNSLPVRSVQFAVAAGTNTVTAAFVPKPVLFDGAMLQVRAAAANTAAATFNPNGLGALAITKQGGTALAAGDIAAAGHELLLRYRASPARYELLNPATAGGGGGSTPTGTGWRHVTAGVEDGAASTPTKSDVGLGSVDNTSDATKLAVIVATANTWTANQTIWRPGFTSGLIVDSDGGGAQKLAVHNWRRGGVLRWQDQLTADETGAGNAGASITRKAYSDAGAYLGDVYVDDRPTQVRTYLQPPKHPTPGAGDNSTKSATTAFVTAAVAAGAGTSGVVNATVQSVDFQDFRDVPNSGWTSSVSGVSAGVSQYTTTIYPGRPGVARLATGSATTGGAALADSAANWLALGGGSAVFEFGFMLPVLSTATDRYGLNVGLRDVGIGSANNRLVLAYTDNENSGNWNIRSTVAGVTTDVAAASGPAAATWYWLKIVVNAAGTSAEFFLNGTSIGTTTAIPTAAMRRWPLISKTAGTTSRDLLLDVATYQITLTTTRG